MTYLRDYWQLISAVFGVAALAPLLITKHVAVRAVVSGFFGLLCSPLIVELFVIAFGRQSSIEPVFLGGNVPSVRRGAGNILVLVHRRSGRPGLHTHVGPPLNDAKMESRVATYCFIAVRGARLLLFGIMAV